MPVDWVTGYSPLAGVRLYAVSPPCVTPDASLPSTIVDREAAAGGRRRRRIGARARGPRSGRGPARRGSSRGGVALVPGGDAWAYAAAVQPRRGRTTTA